MNASKVRHRSLSSCLVVALAGLALSGCAGDAFASFSPLEPEVGPEPQPGQQPGPAPAGSSGVSPIPNPEAPAATPPEGSAGSESGGVVGAGGAGGSGSGQVENAGGAAMVDSLPTFDLIDDLEGDFPRLPERAGRNGAWYMVHDDSGGYGTFSRVPLLNPELPGSQYAARVNGSGFRDWGAQLGVALSAPATGYDASNYCGVRFMAKGSGDGWTLLVSDRPSVPQGGVCGAWNGEACYHFLGKPFSVGPAWQPVEIAFSELSSQMDPGSDRKLEASAIYDLLFNFYSPAGDAFELLVDDLSFIEKPATGCPVTGD